MILKYKNKRMVYKSIIVIQAPPAVPDQQTHQARLAQQQQQQQIIAAQQAQQSSVSNVQSHQLNQISTPAASAQAGSSASSRILASSPSVASGNVKTRVAGTLHDARSTPTVNLQPGQRLATANFGQVSQNPAVIGQKSGMVYMAGSKLNPAQVQQLLKNQNLLRQQQQLKLMQTQAAGGQKMTATVAVSTAVGMQQRNTATNTLIKQSGSAGTISQQVPTSVKRQVR